MYFQRFYDTPLAQASYLIGCQVTGDAGYAVMRDGTSR